MSLTDQLGLGPRELISIVGGGGKSTVLFKLGGELAATGHRVLLTTTTKMGRSQTVFAPTLFSGTNVWGVLDSLSEPGPILMITGGNDHKITGPHPALVDELYAEPAIDYIIVEADGSHGRPLKAPASHEPVVPATTSMVIILMGIDAVGQPLGAAAHRVKEAIRFTGLSADHILTPADCAAILSHPDGALRVCPRGARVIVGLTKVETARDLVMAQEVGDALRGQSGIDRCLPISVGDPLPG